VEEEITDTTKIITMKVRMAIMMILEIITRLKTLGRCRKPRREEDGRSTKERRHPQTPKARVANNLNNLRKVIKKRIMEAIKASLQTNLMRSRKWHPQVQMTLPHKLSSTKSIKH
jgi:hypothetical protein